MGRLVYDGIVRLRIDDRDLAHLQIVISEKLRRRESFTLTWPNALDEGGGRVAVWVHASTSLVFTFERRGPYEINPAWVAALSAAAHSPGGLHPIAEPQPEK
jgi:hypothetical protein